MVRVLLIRHGESEENATMHDLFNMVARKEIAKEEFRAGMKERMAPDGDSPLTAAGLQQVSELGSYWAPLLAEKAARGSLHMFVSPFSRTMGTADPLMSALYESFGTTAAVRQELGEVPGLVAREDIEVVDQAEELSNQGRVEEARGLLATHDWRECGMTPKQLLAKFPWARLEGSSLADHPEDLPWYTRGWERPSVAAARAQVNTEFLRSLQERLPNNDVVVLVAHGMSLGLLLKALLTSGSSTVSIFSEVENTSVTSLFLESPDTQNGMMIMGMGMSAHFPQSPPLEKAKLEFFNRVDHLSGTQSGMLMHNWMQRKGVLKRKSTAPAPVPVDRDVGAQIQVQPASAASATTLRARL